MSRWIVATFLLLFACRSHRGEPPSSPTPASEMVVGPLENHFTAVASRAHAMVAGVVTAEGVAWVKSYGEAPNARDTVFRIGSLTKVLTGIAILKLRDDGELSLDDTLTRFVPEADEIIYPSGALKITLRHVLAHTSGIPRLGKLEYTKGDHDMSESELISELAGLKLDFAPGTKVEYSNLAVALMGLVVARASGTTYRDYVTANVFRPLGMTRSFFSEHDVPAGALAPGYVRDPFGDVSRGGPHWRLGAMEAMGGAYSTFDDMAKLVAWQLAPERGGPLKSESVRESQRAAFPNVGDMHFGVAWIVADAPDLGRLVAMTGATLDYAASLALAVDKRRAVVILASGADFDEIGHAASRGLRLAVRH